MLPFPQFPAATPDMFVPTLLLVVGTLVVAAITAIYIAWAERREEAAEHVVREMPTRTKKAA